MIVHHQFFAIKVSKSSVNGKYRDLVLAELEIMKPLQHINIVNYYEAFVSQNRLCIVMEFCSGGDLRKVINAHLESGWVTTRKPDCTVQKLRHARKDDGVACKPLVCSYPNNSRLALLPSRTKYTLAQRHQT